MTPIIQLFIILLVCGTLLITVEIFVPGGVLGSLGALALLAACGTAFAAFGTQIGFLVAFGVLLLTGLFIMVWLMLFPKTAIGRRLTLSKDGKNFKPGNPEEETAYAGKTGTTVTELHPAGIAEIEGRRIDVISDGSFIPKGTPIIVTNTQGNHLTVCELESSHEPQNK